MILELDCGNTLIKWRLLDREGRVRDGDMAPDLVELQRLLGGQEREIHGCRLVSVRSEDETQVIFNQLTSWLKRAPLLARPSQELEGVRNGYEDYRRLGMDRWLALVAGYRLAGGACVVIDLGTRSPVTLSMRMAGIWVASSRRAASCCARPFCSIRAWYVMTKRPRGTFWSPAPVRPRPKRWNAAVR